MGPFDVQDWGPVSYDDRELVARCERIERALGIGPPPKKEPSRRGTFAGLANDLRSFYAAAFEKAR